MGHLIRGCVGATGEQFEMVVCARMCAQSHGARVCTEPRGARVHSMSVRARSIAVRDRVALSVAAAGQACTRTGCLVPVNSVHVDGIAAACCCCILEGGDSEEGQRSGSEEGRLNRPE